MSFRLGRIKIRDIHFGEETKVIDGTLFINRHELESLLTDTERIREVKVELARPGESIRIIPVKDILEPRVKVDGKGGVFPGFIGSVETVGEGQTNVLDGVVVINCGKLVNFQEGLIDMTGPGAEIVHFSRAICNVVLLIEPVDGIGKHEHEAAERLVGLKAAAYLGEAARHIKPDEIKNSTRIRSGKSRQTRSSAQGGLRNDGFKSGADARYVYLRSGAKVRCRHYFSQRNSWMAR